jgi:hypothetical protein
MLLLCLAWADQIVDKDCQMRRYLMMQAGKSTAAGPTRGSAQCAPEQVPLSGQERASAARHEGALPYTPLGEERRSGRLLPRLAEPAAHGPPQSRVRARTYKRET